MQEISHRQASDNILSLQYKNKYTFDLPNMRIALNFIYSYSALQGMSVLLFYRHCSVLVYLLQSSIKRKWFPVGCNALKHWSHLKFSMWCDFSARNRPQMLLFHSLCSSETWTSHFCILDVHYIYLFHYFKFIPHVVHFG